MRQARARTPQTLCRGTLVLSTLLAIGPLLVAPVPVDAEEPDPPPFYAITGARVLTVSGGELEEATILIGDGLIEAIGSDLDIPADAWRLDASGLVVYPGLIDALGPAPTDPRSGGRGARGPAEQSAAAPVRGPEDRPATTPWRRAPELYDRDDERLERWRKAGFTSWVTAPDDGFFPGQAALLNLSGGELRDIVVKSPVAQRLELAADRRRRTFPGSLMGRIAYIRQVLTDARHYALAHELYDADPRGRERPPYDRTLDPLVEALSSGLPFMIPAQQAREIDRALALAHELDLSPLIVGAEAGYDRAERLAAKSAPVIVSLDWPELDRDRDPDADVPFETLFHQSFVPTTPHALAEAGVLFAFGTAGESRPERALLRVRQAVEAGLDPRAALRALTLDAAAIFGADDRLGSVEVGKTANLVISSGEPWAEGSEVHAVFVDGRHFEIKRKTNREPPATDASGTWALEIDSPRGLREATLVLTMAVDGSLTGSIESERGSRRITSGHVEGLELTFEAEAPRGPAVTYRGELAADELKGTVSIAGTTAELTGSRQRPAVAAVGPEPQLNDSARLAALRQELERARALYRGPVRRYERLAITHAVVHTVAAGTVDDGTVLVENGKIKAVGQDVRIPAGTEIVDAAGQHLMPGILDAHSHIAIEGGVNEGSLAVTAMVSIEDVINPDDISLYRALAGGVTTANLLHGSANPIGGKNAVVKLRWGADAHGLLLEGAPPGIKFALGENPKRSRGAGDGASRRYPATRMGVMDVVRQAFTDARAYGKAWKEYEARAAAGERPTPPPTDYKLETLLEILNGTRLVHAHCYRADEILQLLRLAEEQGFRIATLQHVLEGYKVADEIAVHGAGASTFSDWWAYKVEAFDAIPYNAALMTERGIVVSINSDDAEEMRHLNQEAAKAVKWGGLDEDQALSLVTLNPARQLGIADRIGSIEVGKDADLVLYDRHPLSAMSVVKKTFVDGDLYFDREADRERQRAIDAVKSKILDPPRARSPESSTPPSQATPERSTTSMESPR